MKAASGQFTGKVRLTAVLAFLLALSVGNPLCRAQPAAQSPLNLAILKHSLYRDPDLVRMYRRAVAAQERGELLQALTSYQSILAGASDSIFWSTELGDPGASPLNPIASRTTFRSVRSEVRRRLEKLIEDEPQVYEQTHERQAAIFLNEARESGSQARLEEVVRRFFETRAGFDAVEQLATQALDQNSPQHAARLLGRLMKSKVHRSRITPAIIIKAGCALHLSGDPDAALKLLQEALRSGLPAEQLAKAEEVIANVSTVFPQKSQREQWRTPYGNVSHNGSGIGTIPWLNPAWSQPLAIDDPFEPLVSWERRLVSEEMAQIGTVVMPVVVNGQLIVRDFNGLRAVDPRTGKLLWRFDGRMSVPRLGEALRTTRYTTAPGELAHLAWFGNAMLGHVTSDGERVYAVDLLGFVSEDLSVKSARARNRIVALKIPAIADAVPDEALPLKAEVAWKAGGSAEHSATDPLSGHLFLGPPLPIGGVLFAITEFRRELNLVKLDAATGRVVWMQRFGLVEQPVFHKTEVHRAMAAYLPCYADGLVICPTGTGLVVVIDAMFGEIVWASHCGDLSKSNFRGSSATISKKMLGFSGMPNPPIAFRDSVVYLPRISARLHCLNLKTGRRAWTVPRDDALYVGSVTDEGVLVVGKTSTRLLALDDGHELWTRVSGVPSGRGVRSGNQFMLPLKSGAVTVIDLASGEMVSQADRLEESFTLSPESSDVVRDPDEADLSQFGLTSHHRQSNLRPGNLLLYDGLVISTGPRHITVLAQAESLMQDLYAEKTAKSKIEAQVLLARLEFSTGRVDAAEERLAALLEQSDVSKLDSARRILQKLLMRQLHESRDPLNERQRLHLIEALDQLAQSSDEKWQVFVERTRLDVDRKAWDLALPAARTLSASDVTSFVQRRDDPLSAVRSDVWGRNVLARLEASERREHWETLLERDASLLGPTADNAALRRFLRLYPTSTKAGRVQNRLADRLIQKGSFQEAELLLIDNRRRSSGETQAVAGLLLISLWELLGLHGEAGIALADFAQQHNELPLPSIIEDDLTTLMQRLQTSGALVVRDSEPPHGRTLVDAFDESSPTRRVFGDLQPLPWEVRRVAVRKFSLQDTRPDLTQTWTSGRVLNVGKRSGFDLLRRGNVNHTEWMLVDRFGGTERGQIEMPGRTSLPISTQYRMIGHFMPVGSPAQMNGVSLLEFHDESPLWQLRFPRVAGHELVEAGPATPSVCVFQTRKHLIGIDPASGRVLWRNSDLDLSSGVYVDKEAGLFGDDEILIMFHADQRSWTKFSTKTGEILETGTLDVEFRYLRYVFGRKLFHVMKDAPNQPRKRIRIWDPRTKTFDFDEQIDGRFYVTRTPDNGLLALLQNPPPDPPDNPQNPPETPPGGRLRIFRMPDVVPIADVRLTPDQMEGVSALRIFADGETLFVNTQRTVNLAAQQKYHYLATDSTLPADHVQQGTLIAIDQASGQVLWSHHCRQRTFLRLERTRLPFLVSLSRVRPRNRTNIHGIELETIDRRTGELLGSHRQLIPDRFVHSRMNREQGVLELYGLSSRVDLDFSRQTQRILLEHGPL